MLWQIRGYVAHTFIAGFWQYGSVSWNKFRAWLNTLILTREPWAIFGFDEHTRTLSRGERYSPSSEEIVPPGTYILLQEGANFRMLS